MDVKIKGWRGIGPNRGKFVAERDGFDKRKLIEKR